MREIVYDRKSLSDVMDHLDALDIGYTVTSIKAGANPSARTDDNGWIIEFEDARGYDEQEKQSAETTRTQRTSAAG